MPSYLYAYNEYSRIHEIMTFITIFPSSCLSDRRSSPNPHRTSSVLCALQVRRAQDASDSSVPSVSVRALNLRSDIPTSMAFKLQASQGKMKEMV